MSILTTLRNAWKTVDLRKKILFTVVIIVLFRIGASIPVPFINAEYISAYFSNSTGNLLGYLNMISGNALSTGTIFAMTIQPYINASIIVQLLTVAIPYFERLARDGGEEGKKKLNKITRYSTLVIALLQAIGYYKILDTANALTAGANGFENFVIAATIVICLVAGSCLVMWLGESIDGKGIGNGISMILFASIVSRGTDFIMYLVNEVQNSRWWMVILVLVYAVLMFAFIVFMDNAERRIPIQYAKRQVGRRMYGGQNTHLPIKVAMTGVMPIIFTFAIVSLPSTIGAFFPGSGYAKWVEAHFDQTSPIYIILTFVLIIAFNYFYIAIQYNPTEIANNIKNNGGTIPGIRPGQPTVDFIMRSVNKITLFGALFLGVIAVLPFIFQIIFPNSTGLALGGTSMLILVSVSLETIKVLESQMLMQHYRGFLE